MKIIHFSGLEKDLNCSKYNNIILSWNSNNNYIKGYKNKEIFYVAKFWHKNLYKVKNKVIKFKKRLFPNLCKELNLVNNINYSNKEWEILLEPWLNLYLETNYFRWLIINQLTKTYKNFDYLEIKVKKKIPSFDTLQFNEFNYSDDVFNHLIFQDILEFIDKTKGKRKLKNKVFRLQNKFINKIYKKIKNNFFLILYEKIISNIFQIKTLINLRTRKINFIKICLKLKILPFKGLSVFNRNNLIKISNKESFEKKKRLNLRLNSKSKNEFENYIFEKIKNDIPRIFIENFSDIKKLHKNELKKTNLVVTDTMHEYNPIFKSWLAEKKNLDKNFKIITADHGGLYGAGKKIYNYNNSISTIYLKYQKDVSKNQISLPCLFLNKNNNNKSKKDKILIICKDIPKYPRHFFNGPMSEEINFEYYQIKSLTKNLKEHINKKILIRPYTVYTGWKLHKKYQEIVGKNKIIFSNSEYQKLRDQAIIRIITYPQTAFLESLINGPTFLLLDTNHWYEIKKNEKLMNILFKNKIAFKNGKDLAIHLNNIEDNIFEWWKQKKIQQSIDLFLENTNIYKNNPTTIWAKELKKFT